MSLIKCPECNKEISDKAKCCPNCGYELPKQEEIHQGIYCPKCLDSRFKVDEYEKCWLCKVEMINSIQGTFDEVWHYGDNHPELKESPEFDEQAYQRRINWVPVEYGTAKLKNLPKCPTCGSTNIEKISMTKKAFGGVMFGLFSSDVRNTMHCKNCGAKW